MLSTYEYKEFPYVQTAEQKSGFIKRHKVVVIGSGPVGLTSTLDLARQGIEVVVVSRSNTVSVGSRAVCYAKRTLEIWDRLNVAERLINKGVVWKVGKVFRDEDLVYQFDLLPESNHKIPAFINLQQYFLEEYIINECQSRYNDLIYFRWSTRVVDIKNSPDYVTVTVETPDGVYSLEADYVIACDGSHSSVRDMLGITFEGHFFQDRFLIADIVMKADFPAERWFWFNPPFHKEQSVLLHMQADDVWRIDFQLGWDCDPEEEKKPENVIPRLREMLGDDKEFELEWVSVYQFACRQLHDFKYGRVLMAGDAAHQVSPFGARGANSGVQDADNLIWKLKLVLEGKAPESLLDSYSQERVTAAKDNLKNSSRSTDFISPKSEISRVFRDATLVLAKKYPFARPLINSGRLSTPTPYHNSPLNTPDTQEFEGNMRPGTNCSDAPIVVEGREEWFLTYINKCCFVVLTFDKNVTVRSIERGGILCDVVVVGKDINDSQGLLKHRYGAGDTTTYLIRPDQYVAARWHYFNVTHIKNALRCATAQT